MTIPYNRVYKKRGVLMAPPVLLVLFLTIGEVEWDQIIWPIGLGIFATGVAIRVWAQIHLHYRLSVRKQLTTTGPYAHVRNPIYIANTLMLLGLTVLSELIWFLPLMLLWCAAVYHFVVRREEAHLSDKYGQPYRDYLQTVPRWLPRFASGQKPATGMARQFILASLLAESHCLLLLIPFLIKELAGI